MVPERSGNQLNDVIEVTCSEKDIQSTQLALKCLPSGNWNNSLSSCYTKTCPRSIVSHAPPMLKATVRSYKPGGVVTFSCTRGYSLKGPSSAACQTSGVWSVSEPPRCQRVTCPNVDTPKNGRLKQPEKHLFAGSILRFKCHRGYLLKGSPSIQCREDGHWSDPPPKCVVACSYPGSVVEGFISKLSFLYHLGEEVSFSCAADHKLVGARKIKCIVKNGSGEWSNAIPFCEKEGA